MSSAIRSLAQQVQTHVENIRNIKKKFFENTNNQFVVQVDGYFPIQPFFEEEARDQHLHEREKIPRKEIISMLENLKKLLEEQNSHFSANTTLGRKEIHFFLHQLIFMSQNKYIEELIKEFFRIHIFCEDLLLFYFPMLIRSSIGIYIQQFKLEWEFLPQVATDHQKAVVSLIVYVCLQEIDGLYSHIDLSSYSPIHYEKLVFFKKEEYTKKTTHSEKNEKFADNNKKEIKNQQPREEYTDLAKNTISHEISNSPDLIEEIIETGEHLDLLRTFSDEISTDTNEINSNWNFSFVVNAEESIKLANSEAQSLTSEESTFICTLPVETYTQQDIPEIACHINHFKDEINDPVLFIQISIELEFFFFNNLKKLLYKTMKAPLYEELLPYILQPTITLLNPSNSIVHEIYTNFSYIKPYNTTTVSLLSSSIEQETEREKLEAECNKIKEIIKKYHPAFPFERHNIFYKVSKENQHTIKITNCIYFFI